MMTVMGESQPLLHVAIIVHDDHYFLRDCLAAVSGLEATVFISTVPWAGKPGDWGATAKIAAECGARVVQGEWPDENSHRQSALALLKAEGVQSCLVLDSDEILSPQLIESLKTLSCDGFVDVVRCEIDTYWKTTSHVIKPPEKLHPVVFVNPQTVSHSHLRSYLGERTIFLDRSFGVLHHLSYVGSDKRIIRKLESSSHRDEVIPNWWEDIWLKWDKDSTIGDLHPTHPPAFQKAIRYQIPPELENVDGGREPRTCPDIDFQWPSVSVVIPLYGGPEDLRSSLSGLKACRDLLSDVVVVDDRSPDAAAAVVGEFASVRLIVHEENLGFASACNTGFDATDGSVVIFLNSDAVLTRPALIRLVEATIPSTVGLAGPIGDNVGYFQGSDFRLGGVDQVLLHATDFAYRNARDEAVSMLVGFCLAIKRSVLAEVGLFDTSYGKGLFEDNDLCYRVQRAGYQLALCHRAFVSHVGSQSLLRAELDPTQLLSQNHRVFEQKWRYEVDCGYASHLPGERREPITFRADRSPEELASRISALASQANISLCMIVRDEERVIADCLSSSRGFFRETIVVDTGSIDRTLEILKGFNVELRCEKWADSFAAARNVSIRGAKGDWIFWMDADDTLPAWSAERILHAAASAPPEVIGFVIPVKFVENGVDGTQVDHVKLFRNLPGLQFEGRIHEQILPSLRARGGEIQRIDAVVLHSGYDTSDAGQAKKRRRDEHLLKLDLEERPNHPFVLFNLGMTAHYTGEHVEAIEWLDRSLSVSSPAESHVRKAIVMKGQSLKQLGRINEAMATFGNGLEVVGEDPELRFQLAMILAEQNRPGEARLQYEAIPENPPGYFSSFDIGILGVKKHFNLGGVCMAMGDYPGAKHYWSLAANSGAGFLPAAQMLFEKAIEREDYRTAREALQMIEQLDGRGEVWADSVEVYASSQELDPAVQFQQLINQQPGDTRTCLALYRFYLKQGREKEAEPLLSLLSQAGVPQASFYAGVNALRNGKISEALKYMLMAEELDPENVSTQEQVAILREMARKV